MQRNNPKEFVVSIDDAALEIERGINAAIAIYTAMMEGPFNPDEFMDGMYFVLTRLEKCTRTSAGLSKTSKAKVRCAKQEAKTMSLAMMCRRYNVHGCYRDSHGWHCPL